MDSPLETNEEGGGRKRKPRGLLNEKVSGGSGRLFAATPYLDAVLEAGGEKVSSLELRPGGQSPQG